jgi:hypothetical protein
MRMGWAMVPNCARCGEAHWNFNKCRVKENQNDNISLWKTRPNLPEGWRIWNKDYLEEFERRGELIIRKAGIPLRDTRQHDALGYYKKKEGEE